MNQQQSQGNDSSGSNGLGKLLLVCRAFAISIEVFLHKGNTFGERYIGPQAALALPLIFFFTVFWPQADPAPLAFLAALFLLRIMWIGAANRARRFRGSAQPHSFYTGRPFLMSSKGKTSEAQIKGASEPILVAFLGLVIQGWNEPLGTYLIIAAVALSLTVLMSVRQDRMRALDLNDAMDEQRRIADQWRTMRRD